MFYKIHRGQVNTSLPYDLTCVPVYGRTRARDMSNLFIYYYYYYYYILQKNHSYPQIAKAKLDGLSEIDILTYYTNTNLN